MKYAGIDPGKGGGMAILEDEIFDPIVYAFKNMTEADIADAVIKHLKITDSFAMLESVHAMPGQGVCSMFSFGQSYGFLRGVLSARLISFELITPQKWQKDMNCRTKGDKNVSKAAAQRLFPSVKCTHSIADALLLAEYCKRTCHSRNRCGDAV